ncbi:MAG: triphosphoribosyl-dephospho-CoA synthase [Clostridiaceae bacterium]
MENATSIYDKIGACCVSAMLSEVSASPKPGLVDRFSCGAHTDMDFLTFTESIAAISPYFSKFAEIGSSLKFIDKYSLGKIRPLGIECEKTMFKATNGVNTHKGAIFSMGIIAASAGFCCSTLKSLSSDGVCTAAGVIAMEAEKDFYVPDKAMTKGRQLYAVYGMKGIRGETGSGFSSVRKYALPVMRELFMKGCYFKNDIYLQVLLHLMAHVVDTNVAARCGIEAIEYLKSSAKNALAMGGALTDRGREELFRMDREYTNLNISPGGCADLLSAAITLYNLENIKIEQL